MQPTAPFRIPTGAKWPIGFRYHGEDLPSGVTVVSVSHTVSPAVGLTVDTPIVNTEADGFFLWITATTAGDYVISTVALRSDGATIPDTAYVTVGDTALSDDALVTVDDVRTFLGLKSGSSPEADIKLVPIIEAVSAAMSGSADCDFLPVEDIEETKNGTGMSYLYLDHWPVVDLTSVVEDEVTLVEDTDFYLDYDLGILWKLYSGKWTTRRRGVVVTYDAGHEAVPADVKLAAIVESARAFSSLDKQMFGESSRTEDSVSITINTDELLPATLETLGRYRRVQI